MVSVCYYLFLLEIETPTTKNTSSFLWVFFSYNTFMRFSIKRNYLIGSLTPPTFILDEIKQKSISEISITLKKVNADKITYPLEVSFYRLTSYCNWGDDYQIVPFLYIFASI